MDSNTNMDDEVEIILQQDQVEVTEPLVADYILPTATETTLGGVKIGDNIDIDSNGVISVPTASSDTKGVVRIGSGLSIDSNGVVSSSASYTLPQATKTTLGGVYVDDALNNSSQNPVQNAVVSLAIGQTNGNLSTVSSTVGGLSTTVGNLNTSVSSLSNQVGTNTSSISSLTSRVTDAESDIGSLDTSVTMLQTETYESYTYEDIDDAVWSAGVLELVAYGMNGYINVDLQGSLTIASGASATVFTLPSILPAYTVNGVLLSDAGCIKITVTDGGVISFTNLSTTSVTITGIAGSVPIVVGSDAP